MTHFLRKIRMLKIIPVVVAFQLFLEGCTFRPSIQSATYSYIDKENAELSVFLKTRDAEIVKKNQYYFSLVVVNCTLSGAEEYPASAYVGKATAASFDFPLSSPTVEFSGSVPSWIMKEYDQPCVYLRGGGILSGHIKSDLKPLIPSAS